MKIPDLEKIIEAHQNSNILESLDLIEAQLTMAMSVHQSDTKEAAWIKIQINVLPSIAAYVERYAGVNVDKTIRLVVHELVKGTMGEFLFHSYLTEQSDSFPDVDLSIHADMIYDAITYIRYSILTYHGYDDTRYGA